MIAAVLFEEGLLSRSNPSADRARAGRTGGPRIGRQAGDEMVERREAQRPPSMGARGLIVPREVGPLIPPQRVPRKHSGASRRSTALAHLRGTWETSDAIAPRECGSVAV